MGFGLINGFTGLSHLVTTCNCNAFADSRTRLLAKAHTGFSVCLHNNRRLVMAHNNVDSSASVLNVSCPRWLATDFQFIAPLSTFELWESLTVYPWLSLTLTGCQRKDWLTAKFLLLLANTALLCSQSLRTHELILRSDGSGSLPDISLGVNCWAVSYIAAGLLQKSHFWLQSPRDPWPRFLFFHRHVRVYKWGLYFDEGRGRSFYIGATFVAP
jgi:hypothetical protein